MDRRNFLGVVAALALPRVAVGRPGQGRGRWARVVIDDICRGMEVPDDPGGPYPIVDREFRFLVTDGGTVPTVKRGGKRGLVGYHFSQSMSLKEMDDIAGAIMKNLFSRPPNRPYVSFPIEFTAKGKHRHLFGWGGEGEVCVVGYSRVLPCREVARWPEGGVS